MNSGILTSPPGRQRRRRWHLLLRFATLAVAVLTSGAALSIACTPARADSSYHAQLNGGGTTFAPEANDLVTPSGGSGLWEQGTGSNGAPVSTFPWDAPSGTMFTGFIYGAGFFYGTASTHPYTGALSGGFWGISSSGEDVVFPYADDCSVHGSNGSGMYWTADSWAGQAEDTAKGYCSESGNPKTWQLTNVEDDYSTGATTTSGYTTLELHVACDSGNCPNASAADAEVTDLSANVDDPQSKPINTSLSWNGASSTGWYTTDTNAPKLTWNALDPSGVCVTYGTLTGPQTVVGGDQVPAPAGVSDAAAGTEYTSDEPCNGAENYNWTLPAGIASGNYTTSALAANAGQYEAAGFSNSSATTIASGLALNVDNTVPTVQITPPISTSTTAKATVTSGPSGINLACTVDGSTATPTLVSGSKTSAGTTTWDVPDYEQLGVKCTATNNDLNQALSATAVDYSDAANVEGDWDGASQDVGVTATTYKGANDGINRCYLDDSLLGSQDVIQVSDGAFTDETNAQAASDCWSNDNSTATYGLWVDTQPPALAFTGAAATDAQKGISVHSQPTLDMVGSEAQTLSAVTKVVCKVDGVASAPLTQSTTDATDDGGLYTFSPTLSNGTHTISCTPTTGAGTPGAAVNETLKVDDPNQEPDAGQVDAYGASPSINDAGAVYSPAAGSGWQRNAQQLTIRADHTGGVSPIVKITCANAVFGGGSTTATITGPAGSSNGIDATVTVDAANAHLSCVATDDAGDSFPLGTWTGQVDGPPAGGSFVGQAQWPSPSAIEINAVDANDVLGSGVATVDLRARNSKTGVTIDLGLAQSQGGDLYEMTNLPDGELPAGRYALSAVVTDAAGNASTIAGPTLQFPLRQATKLTVAAGKGRAKRSAGQEAATPAAIADANEATAHSALPAVWAGGKLTPAAKSAISIANASAKIAKVTARAKKKTVAVPRIKLAYGQKLTLTGKLTDSARHGQAVRGAAIRIYAKANGSRTITLLHTVHTGRRGKWSYRVRAGVSRILYVTYPGNSRLRSATDELRQAFSGKVTTSASGAFVAGHKVTLMGRVRGGHIPAGGVHLQIWYTVAGSGAPLTHWMDVTSQRNGRWRYSFRLNGYTAGLTYEFEARVRGQSGWPYRGATSRPLVKAIS